MRFEVSFWNLEEPHVEVIEATGFDIKDGVLMLYNTSGLMKAYGRTAWQTVSVVDA